MEDRLQTAQDAATGFVRHFVEDMEIVDFDGRVEIRQTFTGDKAALREGPFGTLPPVAPRPLPLPNLRRFAPELRKIRASSAEEIRRRAIVVLSDGEDTSSILSYEDVLDPGKLRSRRRSTRSGSGRRTTGRGKLQEAEFVLKQLAFETGGRLWFRIIGSARSVYEQIATELASRTIGYASKNSRRDGAWRGSSCAWRGT